MRAVKGIKAAGVEVSKVEIGPEGTIIVFTASAAQDELSPLEKWKRVHARAS